ncbi:MAG: hypothetical protein LBK13_10170 [Spirochaetales bacterium]|jgi:hypothetical protein|nr:hypothetical protein [Spirochaetales bacterium]
MGISDVTLKTALQGRSPEQQKVIKYFMAPEGCFSKNISDEEYDQLVLSKYTGLNLKQRALDKTGVDESQVNEIPPCEFKNWHYDKNARAKRGKDGRMRTSAYQVTWLLFSDKQVYVYQYTFNMDEDGKKEKTEEYFYKDITNFSTSSESEEKETWEAGKGCLNKVPTVSRKNVDHDIFKLIVPGDQFSCDMINDSEAEDKIKAMKNKLREKKG